jgi:hypothetical protein
VSAGLQRFIWGAVGATGTEVYRLYKIFVLGVMVAPHFSLAYLFISVAFIIVAGLFAVAWQDNKPLKCIYIGLTLPAIISGWSATSPPPPPRS